MGKKERDREKMGIGWIKGPCERKKKKAHVATETDKVMSSRVALTERENNSVITVLASLPAASFL